VPLNSNQPYLCTSLLVYFLIYLSTSFTVHLQTRSFFQAVGRWRRPNLAVVFWGSVLSCSIFCYRCMFAFLVPSTGSREVMRRNWCVNFGHILIVCLCVYLLHFVPHFCPSLFSSFLMPFFLSASLLDFFLTYLSTFSRLDPFCFHSGGRRRPPNLSLVSFGLFYVVVHFVTYACLLLLCLFQFFSML